MTTRHLVDPELLPMLDLFPAFQIVPETLAAVRAGVDQMSKAAPIPDAPVDVAERRIAGPDGAPDIRLLIYTPRGAASRRAGFLHIHGGGYVMGTPEMSDARNRLMAADIGCVIVSVDYRLSPETPHPGPIEDCYSALKWLHANAASLDVDPARIAIGGESAGGGLAAALALLARDRGEVPVAFQLLIYPMLDDRTAAADPHPYTGEYVWTPPANLFGWAALLGHEPGIDGVSPYAAAARAESLAGLPPAYIGVGALDLFLDENLDYARRLARDGVPVEMHLYPGAFHGFNMMAGASVSRVFERDYREALRRALA